jgi:hypothetical protein
MNLNKMSLEVPVKQMLFEQMSLEVPLKQMLFEQMSLTRMSF